MESRVEGLISQLQEVAEGKAVCVGFGVSGPEQVRAGFCLHASCFGLCSACRCACLWPGLHPRTWLSPATVSNQVLRF